MNEEKFHRGNEPLDDLFRQALGDMRAEPSERVWKKVNRELLKEEVSRFHFTNIPGVYWALFPAVVILTGVIIYFSVGHGDHSGNMGSDPIPEQPEMVISSPERSHSEASPPEVTSPAVITPEGTTEMPAEAPAEVTPAALPPSPGTTDQSANPSVSETVQMASMPKTTSSKATTETTFSTLPPETPEDQPVLAVQEEVSLNLGNPVAMSILDPVGLNDVLADDQFPAQLSPTQSLFVAPPQISLKTPVARSMDLGVNITPDMVFYQNTGGSFKYNYTLDFGARYNFGRFYLESGLGVTYSTSIGDYAISYIKNDSVGYYYEIESYYVDPGNPSAGINFNTKQVTVYDSVHYLYDYNTKNRYLYLQIPLTFGYTFLQRNQWSLSADAGVLYAYLISTNEPEPDFYIPEARILDVERRSPERNLHSLGLSGSVRFEYRFARNMYLLVEPTFKYYLQAVEESSREGVKQPYSVGLRAGIWYRLPFKTK